MLSKYKQYISTAIALYRDRDEESQMERARDAEQSDLLSPSHNEKEKKIFLIFLV